jgi:hypothetical protein
VQGRKKPEEKQLRCKKNHLNLPGASPYKSIRKSFGQPKGWSAAFTGSLIQEWLAPQFPE